MPETLLWEGKGRSDTCSRGKNLDLEAVILMWCEEEPAEFFPIKSHFILQFALVQNLSDISLLNVQRMASNSVLRSRLTP